MARREIWILIIWDERSERRERFVNAARAVRGSCFIELGCGCVCQVPRGEKNEAVSGSHFDQVCLFGREGGVSSELISNFKSGLIAGRRMWLESR